MPLGRQSKAEDKAKTVRAKKQKGKNKVWKPFQPTIDTTTNVMDAIALHPKAADILAAYGLHCFHCAFATTDSIEAGARSHGLTDTDIENLVTDLQELIDTSPARPAVLTLTKAAAQALQKIGVAEEKKKVCLRVTTGTDGSFCMEFDDATTADDRIFTCEGVKNVSLVASSETLWRIGGSTIDFREGRFKLDLAETCECAGKQCNCKES